MSLIESFIGGSTVYYVMSFSSCESELLIGLSSYTSELHCH